MPNTKILKENGQEFYPVTHASLIVGMENQGRMDATYAWDGTGTPDITKIPAGVVVTYDGTSYTGTLAASADTAGRFYLVPSTTVTGEYDRYLTDATGNTITWKPAGTTAIPTPSILDNVTSTDTDKALSANQGKLLKDDLSQLEAKVDELYDAATNNNDSDVVLETTPGTTSISSLIQFDNSRIVSYGGSNDNISSNNGKAVTAYPVEEGKSYSFQAWGTGDSYRPACLASNLLESPGILSIIEKYGNNTGTAVYEQLTITPSTDGYLYVCNDSGVTPSVTTPSVNYKFTDKAVIAVSGRLDGVSNKVDEIYNAATNEHSEVVLDDSEVGIPVERLYLIESARLTTYGAGYNNVSSGNGEVGVFSVSQGVKYRFMAYGGDNSYRSACLASNLRSDLGELTLIEKYGPDSETISYETLTIIPSADGYLYVSTDSTIEPSVNTITEERILKVQIDEEWIKPYIEERDFLFGKKWAVLGDSFTAGATDSIFPSGQYEGKKKVYPYFIGNRTGIDVISTFFASGRTLAFPSNPGTFTNSICNPGVACYYQNIPADVDYITIYLGINDSHHAPGSGGGDGEDNTGEIPIGTITDNTTSTYYGAWNVVLSWLIENRPFAHIGIIVSNGCDTAEYRTAQIAIARKYGIPFIDLNGDDRTPFMLRAQNDNIPAAIKTMRIRKQAVDYDGTQTGTTNWHPNDDAHEFESYFIESFLREI